MRKETDFLGEVALDNDAYYGVNTLRAIENFKISGKKVNPQIISSMVLVKKACAMANLEVGNISEKKANAIILACDEIMAGNFSDQFPVDAFSGGAGTSVNQNVNEVIANRAIEVLDGIKGDYSIISPLDDVNMSQSTNDVFPTAVRISAIYLLKPLSESLARLQEALQAKEHEFADVIKLGRTQLQDALPVFLGQEFGAYAQAISRDRWRIYKSQERLRQINIGGTAVGTGINAKKSYIFAVSDILRQISGLALARSEYMMDSTQNADVFVEVSGLLKTCAVNLSKIANDLRLMSSGPVGGFAEISLPAVQSGSTIMPGKVNPVIPEAVNQVAFQVMGNDLVITLAAQSGQLELNAFLPVLAENLLNSIEMLNNVINLFIDKCISKITANRHNCQRNVEQSISLSAALIHHIGYEKAQYVAQKSSETHKTIREILIEEKILPQKSVEIILKPYELTKPGIPGESLLNKKRENSTQKKGGNTA